jgi:hypothetical protein
VEGKLYGSLVALIGDTIGKHLSNGDIGAIEIEPLESPKNSRVTIDITALPRPQGDTCPQCNQPALIQQEGCKRCMNCDYSNCG